MTRLLLVAAGGAIGSVGRYLVALWSGQTTSEDRFPLGTLAVNLIGCLAIGLVAGLGERTNALTADTRLFLMTGVIGGFTTFSAFGLETALMIKRDDLVTALAYVAVSVAGGLAAIWCGYLIAARIA